MKYSGGRPVAEIGFDRLHDAFEIARQLPVSVVCRHGGDVLAVIAKIEHQQVEFRQETASRESRRRRRSRCRGST
jgi:hypothetical protein